MAARWGSATRALFCTPAHSRLGPALWRDVGEALRQRIIRRTRAGIDPRSGGLFHGYTRGYRRRRERAGLQTGHVDHVWSGTMLGSIAVFPGRNLVVLRLAGREALKALVHATRHERPWFSLSSSDLASAAALLGRVLLQSLYRR